MPSAATRATRLPPRRIVALPVLTGAMTIAQFVRQELVAGNFERFLVSPTGPVVGILAMLLFPLAFALLLAAITMALGIVLFSVHVDLAGIPLTLGVMTLGCIAFASIGLLFVAALIAFKSAAGVTWVIAGLGLIGGVYFPLSLFPGWIRWAGSVQPLTPTIELLRHLLVGTPLGPWRLGRLAQAGWFRRIAPSPLDVRPVPESQPESRPGHDHGVLNRGADISSCRLQTRS